MLANDLPDDCLLTIFDHMNNLNDLINCYKVCIKWSHLVIERTKKFKYLLDAEDLIERGVNPEALIDNSFDCVYYLKRKPIDGPCLTKLFGNLISHLTNGCYRFKIITISIADFSPDFNQKVNLEDMVAFIRNQKSLKGVIDYNGLFEHSLAILFNCHKLEMISSYMEANIDIENSYSVKQLHLRNYALEDFEPDAHCFPNLEKLLVRNDAGYSGKYNGPVFEKLKILELFISSSANDTYYSFSFIDSCPNLQSAHIASNAEHLSVNRSLKHNSLQDLVLDFYCRASITWNQIKKVLIKYPNLKNLAFRNIWTIGNQHIEQLVDILPNLVLLDVRECPGVDQCAADYVQDYCKRYGRSIKFYFRGNRNEIESDWPQLSTKYEKISRGFDFMKHCFFKDLEDLPFFLIPTDY